MIVRARLRIAATALLTAALVLVVILTMALVLIPRPIGTDVHPSGEPQVAPWPQFCWSPAGSWR